MNYLQKNVAEVIERPPWWHEQGLQQTASGYGSRLTTQKMLRLEGEKVFRRVYAVCWSNSGSAYIFVKGSRQYLAGSFLPVGLYQDGEPLTDN